jgi:hypothetical protein
MDRQEIDRDQPRGRAMWDLDDWKDFAEVVKNFAQTGFMMIAIVALLKWVSKDGS